VDSGGGGPGGGRWKGVQLCSSTASLMDNLYRMAEAAENIDDMSSLFCLCFGAIGFGWGGEGVGVTSCIVDVYVECNSKSCKYEDSTKFRLTP
jgi:hypothetical protein